MKILKNHDLRLLNTWLVGGPAEFYCEPENLEDLAEAVRWAESLKMEVTALGGGSNVLIHDQGVCGLVIGLRKMTGLQIQNIDEDQKSQIRISAWAGTSKSELLKLCLKRKLKAALFLAGLPGDLGGGVVMNAGVAESFKPREFCEIVEWIEVLRPDSSVERISAQKLKWTYRHCEGWRPGVIVRIGFIFDSEPQEDIGAEVRKANQLRLSKQPLDKPSCGSVFRNPATGPKAAQLIDSCGLKGYTLGGAQVSLKHANFIVNLGSATADEIWRVMKHVQHSVEGRTTERLRSEVVLLGPWEDSL